jgi:hypothetical protein
VLVGDDEGAILLVPSLATRDVHVAVSKSEKRKPTPAVRAARFGL